MSERPRLSLVLCTRNRAERLRVSLGYLSKISFPANQWEFVIVDSASSDDTPAVIAEFAGAVPFRVVQIVETAPGLGRARNSGIAAASADILVFTDDDCYPAQDYLQQVLSAFTTDDLDFVGGRVELFSPDDGRATVLTKAEPLFFEPGSFIPAGTVLGANMAVRREVFRRIGGFDELLGPGARFHAADDSEFISRASAYGYRGAYLPGPCVWHHHGRKGAEIEALRRGYDWGRGAFYAATLMSRNRPLKRRYWVLRYWLGRMSDALKERRFGRPGRELLAGALYVSARVTNGGSIRRFASDW